MKYTFKAKDEKGELRTGKVDALNVDAAAAIIQSNGLIPVSIDQESEVPDYLKQFQQIWEGVNQRELAIFFRQLGTLIEAKVSIVSALQAIQEQTENKFLQTVIIGIIQDVEDGMTFSESLAKYPNVFDSLSVNMVKAGEVSGNLQRSILFIADNAEKNYDLTSKIKSALSYPVFILIAAVIIGFLVFTIVLPKLTGIFKDMDVAIPWYTKVLMGMGDFMSAYWWLILIMTGGFVVGLLYYIKTEAGKREWDQIKLQVPVMGDLFRYIYITRFAENLAVLLNGGIPIVRALMIVSEVVNNSVYQGIILRAADEVKTGGSMSSVFSKSSEIPPIVSRMIKIGEESGKVSEVLKNVARFYDKETDRITRNLAALIEPILIIVLGLGVAVLVFAILMPIYNIASKI